VKLSVNWLYRPADVKLAKGVVLEAEPNEIFYSFHKDDILAASLLHPCKVAFLRKGVELPSGVSSFVCRRVYDTASKCLLWLTDPDYTDVSLWLSFFLCHMVYCPTHPCASSNRGRRDPLICNKEVLLL
jgi:hypothetical protein